MMYLSVTYFAKYHADMDAIEQQVREITASWGYKTWTWQSNDKTQVHVNWSAEAAPEDVYSYLGIALDGVLAALRECPPDMATVQIRKGDHSYNTYVTWHSDKQADLEITIGAGI